MSNFHISFSHPWLLFLLLAALLITLIPHLRINKKYRRNRNRIVSLVLHLIILTLSILVLSGIKFEYTEKNEQNEILLLVDMSDSNEKVEQDRDDCVNAILDYNVEKKYFYKIGIVTFGFDQEYAVPLTTNFNGLYNTYKNADLPDTSATDIAAALSYAKGLFTYPETSKIVLITDGKETDEKAMNVIRSVSAEGTKVDVCYIDSFSEEKDLQIYDVVQPDTHISLNTKVDFSFKVKSSHSEKVNDVVYDNGVAKEETEIVLNTPGVGEFVLQHEFTEIGIHELKFAIKDLEDAVLQNNVYSTFVNIEKFNKILVLESEEGSSELLKNTLSQNNEYEVDVLNIKSDLTEIPNSVDKLREYDQVILNNVMNEELPTNIVQGSSKQIDFVDILYEYVEVYGGGLLTTAGTDGDELHAYNRDDLYGTKLQSMLPVQAIDYTPPLGVMIIVDKSGSMSSSGGGGKTLLQIAIDGCQTALDSLTERDMVGVMTLSTSEDQSVLLGLTPRSQEPKIRAAINSLDDDANGATDFYPAISKASALLNAQKNLAKKHIIIISDAGAGDKVGESGYKIYAELADKQYKENGITTSIVVVGSSYTDDDIASVKYATEGLNGEKPGHYYIIKNALSEIAESLRTDLQVPEIKDVNYNDYYATANDFKYSSIFEGVDLETNEDKSKRVDFKYTAFTGTKVKSSDYLVLSGEYSVPIYAQWKFGAGTVGSLMVDVNGKWSNDMFASSSGVRLLKNIINEVMPTKNIHPSSIDIRLKSDNYFNQMSIYTDLDNGEKLEGKVINSEGKEVSLNSVLENTKVNRESECYVTVAMNEANEFSRCNFVLREQGLYKIEVKKVDSEGNVLASTEIYKELSYSKEYDSNLLGENFDMNAYIDSLAEKGKGEVIQDNEYPFEVFDSFVENINKSYDPRIVFMIIAIVLFLTDIAVRKFKFKWPHELIREYKKKKEEMNK